MIVERIYLGLFLSVGLMLMVTVLAMYMRILRYSAQWIPYVVSPLFGALLLWLMLMSDTDVASIINILGG